MQVVAKKVGLPVSPTVSLPIKEMLEEIRNNHIDIEQIIQEELQEFLPQYVKNTIEDIVINVYNNIEEMRVK